MEIFSNKQTNIYSLESIIINFFSAERFIKGFLSARENILAQSNDGKRGYYTFSYPNIGWVQYDHNSIKSIYKLSNSKSLIELYNIYQNNTISNRIKVHSIAAFIIKIEDTFRNLYNSVIKARKFTKDNRLFYMTFTNPFQGIINTDVYTKKYTGKEILSLYNIGLSRKFNSLFMD